MVLLEGVGEHERRYGNNDNTSGTTERIRELADSPFRLVLPSQVIREVVSRTLLSTCLDFGSAVTVLRL